MFLIGEYSQFIYAWAMVVQKVLFRLAIWLGDYERASVIFGRTLRVFEASPRDSRVIDCIRTRPNDRRKLGANVWDALSVHHNFDMCHPVGTIGVSGVGRWRQLDL